MDKISKETLEHVIKLYKATRELLEGYKQIKGIDVKEDIKRIELSIGEFERYLKANYKD